MRSNLNSGEKLILVGGNVDSVRQLPQITSSNPYVGTIEIPGIAKGTACLMSNGKILTCLHNILDYNALETGKVELIDFKKYEVSVYFVKDQNIYKYRINDAIKTGLNKLGADGFRASCFDYALLEPRGNPVEDLGGGLKADQTNYSSPFSKEPADTLAISGPFITMSAGGEIKFHRYISLSENAAANAGPSFSFIAQSGNHPSAPGFSGMAIVPADKIDTLYAIHSLRDNQGVQGGQKISEIRNSMRDNIPAFDNLRLDPSSIAILKSWYEVLTTATRRMDGSVDRGKEIDFDTAVSILQKGGDIAGDNRAEVEAPSKEAWKGKPMVHAIPHKPKGQPHLHHPDHTEYQHPGHAFYPGPVQKKEMAEKAKQAKIDEERRQKQIAETKAKKEAPAKKLDAGVEEEKPQPIIKIRKDKEGDKDAKGFSGRF